MRSLTAQEHWSQKVQRLTWDDFIHVVSVVGVLVVLVDGLWIFFVVFVVGVSRSSHVLTYLAMTIFVLRLVGTWLE